MTSLERPAGFRGPCALACLVAALVTAAPAAAREPATESVPRAAAALGHGSPAPAVRPRAAARRGVRAPLRPLPRVDPMARWRPFVAEASRRFGVPAAWIERVMRAESGGRAVLGGRPVTSRAGAMGLMQLLPRTWAEMRSAHGLGPDPYDPRDNILAGAAYLAWLYRRFGYPGLFGAYNAGPGRYEAWLSGRRALPDETRTYLARVGASRALSRLFAIARAAGADAPARPASAAASAGQASSAPSGALRQAPPSSTGAACSLSIVASARPLTGRSTKRAPGRAQGRPPSSKAGCCSRTSRARRCPRPVTDRTYADTIDVLSQVDRVQDPGQPHAELQHGQSGRV